VDFFLENETNHVIFNEINTFPGFTPISMYPKLWEAEGLHIEALCDLLIYFALERKDRLTPYKHVFTRKNPNAPWAAGELAEFLGGTWAVPPPMNWSASYIAYAGCGAASSNEPPVSVVTPTYSGFRKNAKAYIMNENQNAENGDIPVLVVSNPDDAMMQLVKFGRQSMTGKIVAITGSVGKTSTKDMLSGLLKTFGTCVHTLESQNTLTGIRSVLASLIANPDYAVIEICSHVLNAKARDTVNLVHPDIAVITQVSLSHADELGFKNEADVAICKSRIAENIRNGGICLINHEIKEYELVKKTVESYGARPVSYGLSDKSDVWLTYASEFVDSFFVSANIFGHEVRYEIPYLGMGFALNSLAVLAAAHLLGIDAAEAAKRLAGLPISKHRLSIHTVKVTGGQAKLIDDCFNAQPLSVSNALSTLKLITPMPNGRKVAVLGDIRTFSGAFIGEYKTLTKPILESADLVYLVGKDIMTLKDELPPAIIAGEFADIDAAAKKLPQHIQPNDTVLIKVTSAGRRNANLALKILAALK
jgi:UDP-N-acetylmuramyl pentapeptide synthase